MYDIIKACKQEQLPTEGDVAKAVGRLREGVEVWLNGTALAPLTYDNSWGGINSCGCLFNGEVCDNVYPNCPGYEGKETTCNKFSMLYLYLFPCLMM